MDSSSHTFRSVRTSLKSLVKDVSTIAKIEEIALEVNKINTNGYLFMKLFLLDLIERDQLLPKIDHTFVLNVLKTVAGTYKKRKNSNEDTDKLRTTFDEFYLEYFSCDRTSMKNLTQILNYTATEVRVLSCNPSSVVIFTDLFVFVQICTNYDNNIKLRFPQHVKNFMKKCLSGNPSRDEVQKVRHFNISFCFNQ